MLGLVRTYIYARMKILNLFLEPVKGIRDFCTSSYLFVNTYMSKSMILIESMHGLYDRDKLKTLVLGW